jgi:hypothetical protein
MGQGKKKMNDASHGNHMGHFDEAMENALQAADTHPSDRPQNVTFQVVVSENPGGVKEYIVNITP